MFIHFLCLCPLRLAIMLNFNISKVAYSHKVCSDVIDKSQDTQVGQLK